MQQCRNDPAARRHAVKRMQLATCSALPDMGSREERGLQDTTTRRAGAPRMKAVKGYRSPRNHRLSLGRPAGAGSGGSLIDTGTGRGSGGPIRRIGVSADSRRTCGT
jgi:hypothetical protein